MLCLTAGARECGEGSPSEHFPAHGILNVQAGEQLLGDLLSLMDLIDGEIPNKPVLHGRVFEPSAQKFIVLPPGEQHTQHSGKTHTRETEHGRAIQATL